MRLSFACLLSIVCFFCLLPAQGQDNKWLLGEWRGVGIIPGSAFNTIFSRTMVIKMEAKNRWAGILRQEVMDNKTIRIEKEISGSILNDQIRITTGRTLYVKQPPRGFWADCSSCKMSTTRITVSSDSLILTNELRLCGNYCDGYTTYYRSLADFDTATQRKLVHLFGSPLLAKIFIPVTPAIKYENNQTQVSRQTLPQQQVTAAATPARLPNDTIQKQLSRKNKTIATYNVPAGEIKVELFDNGEIDGDTVTVYHNKQRVIDRQVLGIAPIVFTVKADAQNRVHEFILVADNLGRVPPNTALMRITAGQKIYEIFASTNLQENASVIIVYSGD